MYQLEFMFRTDAPHGLIAFLRQVRGKEKAGAVGGGGVEMRIRGRKEQ